MVLEPGADAPSISAENQWGDRVEPDFDAAVVYLYPRDGNGCLTQAQEFDELYDRLTNHDVGMYGVSIDDVDATCKFAQDQDLDVDLLADPDGEVADAFDVAVEDGCAQRTTFVIARGQILGVYEGVRPDGHARDLLRDLKEIGLVPMSGADA